jgi:hypothetical protein
MAEDQTGLRGNTRTAAGLEVGQITLAFVVLLPLLVLALFIAVDLGRYQIMRNQARIAADSAALAAAGALDISKASYGTFVLNRNWAESRAADAVASIQAMIAEDPWMHISLSSVEIRGSEVEVWVVGGAETIFGGFPLIGLDHFEASVLSSARAATGVEEEW